MKKKLILFTAFGQVVPIPWKKNLKSITMLRRLVGNRGFLSNMNLKYRVSILMQRLYSNNIMCLLMKPLVFPLVKWFFYLCGKLIISMLHIWEKLAKIKTCKEDRKCCTIEEQHQLRFHQLFFLTWMKSWSGFWFWKMFVLAWQ